jgi:hypothetical protein
LQFGVITNFSEQKLTFHCHWHAGEVCSSLKNPGFNYTGQMADNVYGAQFADVDFVNRVPHGGGGVMVWAVWYKLWTTNTIAFYRWLF